MALGLRKGNVAVLKTGFQKLAARKVIAAAGGVVLLGDVFAQISAHGGIIAGKRNGGSKAQIPLSKVINGPAVLVFVAAVRKLKGRRIQKAVKMNCAVLVVFRHNEIFQAVTAHPVVQPLAQLFHDGGIIVAVTFLAVKGNGGKEVEAIAGGKVIKAVPGPSFGPGKVQGLLMFPAVKSGARGLLSVP